MMKEKFTGRTGTGGRAGIEFLLSRGRADGVKENFRRGAGGFVLKTGLRGRASGRR
jgi:hypothetical protein